MKKRIFPMISAAVFAIFSAHAVYLFNRKVYKLCTKLVLDPDVGAIMKYIGITSESIPFIIASIFIALVLIVMIVRVIRPKLAFGIIGSVMVTLSCGVFLFSDLRFEIFMMFRYVYGLTSRALPLIEMCD